MAVVLVLDPDKQELVSAIFRSIDEEKSDLISMFESDPSYPAEYARGQMFAISNVRATIQRCLEERYGKIDDD